MRFVLLISLLMLIVLHSAAGTGYVTSTSVESTRCYDCDYDPRDEDNHGQGHNDIPYAGTGNGRAALSRTTNSNAEKRGFQRCALDRTTDDQRYVRETDCRSGVCFIRQDHNGLVYRGCADPLNLPLGVDTKVQCQFQGLRPAVWWFCNGTLCNSGRFGGGSGICGGQQTTSSGNYGSSTATGSSASSNPYTTGIQSNSSPRYTTTPASIRPVYGKTFEHVQQKLGFGGRVPTVYGGTGWSSEQAFQYYSAGTETNKKSAKHTDLQDKSHQPQSLPQMPKKATWEAQTTTYQVPQTETVTQLTTAVGNNINYQYQKPQKVYVQPPAASDNQSNRKVSPVAHDLVLETSSSGTQQPAIAQMAPSAGNDKPAASPSAYKTWDFVVVAQSRLQRLDNQQQQAVDSAGQGGPEAVHTSSAEEGKSNQELFPPTSNSWKEFYGKMVGAIPAQHPIPSQPYLQTPNFASADYPPPEKGTNMGPSQPQPYEQPFFDNNNNNNNKAEIFRQTSDNSGFNRCDGQCQDNPSGLFPDPTRPNWFIQCGPGMDFDTGLACQCCRPQHMRCPDKTSFDHVTKVCSGIASELPSAMENHSERAAPPY